MSAEERLKNAEVLLDRLEHTRARLEQTGDPDEAIEVLQELSEIAKEVESAPAGGGGCGGLWEPEVPGSRHRPPGARWLREKKKGARGKHGFPRAAGGGGVVSTPDELLELIEPYLDELALTPELGELERSMRYALAGGGKRIRPLLCLATAEAAGAEPEAALPAAAALELVHNFSLVHDDLPSLDNDEVRRGRASTWAEFGEGIGILAGDALLAEALRLALTYPTPDVARELVQATLGMIGGQYRDITGGETDLASLHRLGPALRGLDGLCAVGRRCPTRAGRGAPSPTGRAPFPDRR